MRLRCAMSGFGGGCSCRVTLADCGAGCASSGMVLPRNGPHLVQSMVRDGRLIRLRNGAHGSALSCGRLHDKSGDRDSAADGRDNHGKKGHPLDAQWFSLLRHRAGARPTGLANQRSCGELTFRFENLPYRFRRIGHFEGVSLTVLREMAGHRPRRKTGGTRPFFPLLVHAIDQAMVADQFLGEVGRRMPVNERVRSPSRFNATMRVAILILAD